MLKPNAIAAALALTLCSATAGAANWDEMFQLRSYGTFGFVHSDEDQADFVNNALLQPEGAGYSDSWSAAVDSKLGLQIDAKFSERLSGVVQLVSESAHNNSWDGDANEEFTPSLEWANLSYKVSDTVTVRAGRIVLPFMSVAEFRKVGFAQHWIRPPVDVYGNLGFTSSDGSDVTHRASLGGGVNTARAHFGYHAARLPEAKVQVKAWGFNDTYEKDAWTVRGSYMRLDFRMVGPGFRPLFDTFASLAELFPGGQTAAASARQALRHFDPSVAPQSMELYSIGVNYDGGRWFASSELMRTSTDGLFNSSTAGYLSAGYRWGAFTPYATFSGLDYSLRTGQYRIPLDGLPLPVAGLGAVVNSVIDAYTSTDVSQQTSSLGVRWDFRSNFALKAQFDHLDLDRNSYGVFARHQPGFRPGGNANVFSVAVDYVF